MKSLTIVTDAWHPQVNGVVRSYQHTIEHLARQDIGTHVIHPGLFRTIPCPTYPDIPLSLTTATRVGRHIDELQGDHLHIATEGPLGLMAARYARRNGIAYSSSYHTRFPEYIAARVPVPTTLTYAWLRRLHNRGTGCLVGTDRVRENLASHGFRNLKLWPKGVDTRLFHPDHASDVFGHLAKPIWLCVARVAVEKGLPDFLNLDLPGTKVLVGEGPLLPALRKRYSDVVFMGLQTGDSLAALYASADVFVFPSRTDTFGLVLLEALASGLPVAAFPVMGPVDIVGTQPIGVLSENLREAALTALEIPAVDCRHAAERYDWARCTDAFLEAVQA